MTASQNTGLFQPKRKWKSKTCVLIRPKLLIAVINISAVLVIARYTSNQQSSLLNNSKKTHSKDSKQIFNASRPTQFIPPVKRPPWFDLKKTLNITIWNFNQQSSLLNNSTKIQSKDNKQLFNASRPTQIIPPVKRPPWFDLKKTPNSTMREFKQQSSLLKSSRKRHPKYCKRIFFASKKFIPPVKRPPWFDLMKTLNSTISNSTTVRKVFYLTAEMPQITRLGNRMFLYAALFGIAWRNSGRVPLWNDTRLGLRTIFNGLRIDEDQNGQHRKVQFSTIEQMNTNTSKYTEARVFDHLPPKNVRLRGFFINSKYIGNAQSQLRHDFTFSSEIIRQAQTTLDAIGATSLRKQGYVRVIMHVRRTDYNRLVDKSLKRKPDFFSRSMTYFTNCLPKVHFIVISDNITWCREKIVTVGRKVDFLDGKRSPAVDLAIASLCDHAIITVGTFGWWAAWFANGVTVKL